MSVPGTDSIIDLSHWNTVSSWTAERASAMTAVIHKCSQGLGYDPAYMPRQHSALGAGLLWGAYHFGVQSQDPVKQADYFIGIAAASAAPSKGIPVPKILALDWEWNNADTMTADQAAAFVQRVYDVTGRWPMLYTSAAFLASIPRLAPAPLDNCDLWLTGFTSSPVVPQQWTEKGWKIWQHGIGACAGIDGQVDRDTFNGTPAELAAYFK